MADTTAAAELFLSTTTQNGFSVKEIAGKLMMWGRSLIRQDSSSEEIWQVGDLPHKTNYWPPIPAVVFFTVSFPGTHNRTSTRRFILRPSRVVSSATGCA